MSERLRAGARRARSELHVTRAADTLADMARNAAARRHWQTFGASIHHLAGIAVDEIKSIGRPMGRNEASKVEIVRVRLESIRSEVQAEPTAPTRLIRAYGALVAALGRANLSTEDKRFFGSVMDSIFYAGVEALSQPSASVTTPRAAIQTLSEAAVVARRRGVGHNLPLQRAAQLTVAAHEAAQQFTVDRGLRSLLSTGKEPGLAVDTATWVGQALAQCRRGGALPVVKLDTVVNLLDFAKEAGDTRFVSNALGTAMVSACEGFDFARTAAVRKLLDHMATLLLSVDAAQLSEVLKRMTRDMDTIIDSDEESSDGIDLKANLLGAGFNAAVKAEEWDLVLIAIEQISAHYETASDEVKRWLIGRVIWLGHQCKTEGADVDVPERAASAVFDALAAALASAQDNPKLARSIVFSMQRAAEGMALVDATKAAKWFLEQAAAS